MWAIVQDVSTFLILTIDRIKMAAIFENECLRPAQREVAGLKILYLRPGIELSIVTGCPGSNNRSGAGRNTRAEASSKGRPRIRK
jgi:hypothetical protein